MSVKHLSYVTVLSLLFSLVKCDVGLILMSNAARDDSSEVCSEYNPQFAPYPDTLNESKKIPVLDITPSLGCKSPVNKEDYRGKLVIMSRGNCTFAQRGLIVQNSGGKGVIVVSNTTITSPGASNVSQYNKVNITISLITADSYKQLKSFMMKNGQENVYVQQYAPKVPFWNMNELIIWIVAVVTCGIGAWSQASAYDKEHRKRSSPTANRSQESSSQRCKKKQTGQITVTHALIIFVMCSVSILLMYFFYSYMVYVIISIFCLASCFATYDFFATIFGKSSCFTRHRIPANNIPLLRLQPPIFCIILFLCSAALSVFWAVYRKAWFAWIIQDILGFMFCVNMIKQIRLPSFKICSIILVLFFVYDIFYVFITPLLTKNGDSIMVSIATGGGGKSDEELPMLFKFPRIGFSHYSQCSYSFSLLGFGDIILPGIHIGFCAVWDSLISNTVRRHPYYIGGMIGYGTGLALTFIGMYFMATGQPALLYLTPCCLISTLIVALKRRELRAIWVGKTPVSRNVLHNDEEGEVDAFLGRAEPET